MTILFFVSIGFILYTYAGYPLTLWLLVALRPRSVRKDHIRPRVSVIITARNEADKIRGKIENTLALDYPVSLLEVIVASDASDDETDDIALGFKPRGVRLVRAAERRGKEYAQGLAVSVATGEILVFTDAATILEPEALGHLVQNFADPTVGAASTEDILVDAEGNRTAEGLYVKYEMWVRRLESGFHSLVGLSGSCFAIRKELGTEWSSTLASDFMSTLRAVRRGYRAVADPMAHGIFPAVVSTRAEVARKTRTFLRGIRVLMGNLDMLNPFRYGPFAFQLASHKLFRFVTPFFLMTMLVTSGFLMAGGLFGAIFWAQVSCYALGTAAAFWGGLQKNRVIRIAHYFTIVQWALVLGWLRFLQRHEQVMWEPSRRPRVVAGSPDRSLPSGRLPH